MKVENQHGEGLHGKILGFQEDPGVSPQGKASGAMRERLVCADGSLEKSLLITLAR